MSEEDTLRKLEKAKKQKEKAYIEFKGMIKGIRLGELSQTDEAFLRVMELMFDGFKNVWDDMSESFEAHLRTNQKISNLETKMKELEDNILQLRQTLDKMVQDR